MRQFKLKGSKKDGPELQIRTAIINKLTLLGWYCIITHGNAFQSGLPDIYACHRMYGTRWIEVKNPKGYAFTEAQNRVFPEFTAKGVGIWILVSDSDSEMDKLFKPANWIFFLKAMR